MSSHVLGYRPGQAICHLLWVYTYVQGIDQDFWLGGDKVIMLECQMCIRCYCAGHLTYFYWHWSH